MKAVKEETTPPLYCGKLHCPGKLLCASCNIGRTPTLNNYPNKDIFSDYKSPVLEKAPKKKAPGAFIIKNTLAFISVSTKIATSKSFKIIRTGWIIWKKAFTEGLIIYCTYKLFF